MASAKVLQQCNIKMEQLSKASIRMAVAMVTEFSHTLMEQYCGEFSKESFNYKEGYGLLKYSNNDEYDVQWSWNDIQGVGVFK